MCRSQKLEKEKHDRVDKRSHFERSCPPTTHTASWKTAARFLCLPVFGVPVNRDRGAAVLGLEWRCSKLIPSFDPLRTIVPSDYPHGIVEHGCPIFMFTGFWRACK